MAANHVSGDLKTATFAGGCFWCMQPVFDDLEGVVSTRVGYSGGQAENPTYEEVCSGLTGHAESIQITYDPEKISYRDLLDIFWANIDPTAEDRQFSDVGSQYRTAIFYENEEEKNLAEASRQKLLDEGKIKEIHTLIAPLKTFWSAEDYHQKFYKKNPVRYHLYHSSCGRIQGLKKIWRGS